MASRSFRIRLIDIREEIAGIRDLARNATAESFAASWAMKRAVEHALLIIAEAAKHIPYRNYRRYRASARQGAWHNGAALAQSAKRLRHSSCRA
jgi:uncharacterized protein with HEPN domain